MSEAIPSPQPHTTLRILQTTDLHMCLLPYDYTADRKGRNFSLSQLAPTLTRLRSDGIANCLFDTGDFLQGNQLADFVMQERPRTVPHPMISAMNLLGYDAVSLGNHEFDYGLKALCEALDGLACPALLANVTDPEGVPYFAPTALLTRQMELSTGGSYPLQIGVVGLVTPTTILTQDGSGGKSLQVREMRATASRHSAILKQQGADIIIALCHADVAENMMSETASHVASLPGIDVVLGGHVHETFPDPERPSTPTLDNTTGSLHGKPCVMAGAFGQKLGQIDLQLARTPGGWRVTGHAVQIFPTVASLKSPDPTSRAIAASVNHHHAKTLTYIRRPVAQTNTPIHSYFAQIAPDKSLRLLADACHDATVTALAGLPESALPVLTVAAPYHTGGKGGPYNYVNIANGPITMRDVHAIFPFDNSIVLVKQSTHDIMTRLERAACQFLQIQPNQKNQPLIDPQFAAYNADTVFGLTYRIDLTKPAGHGRIGDVRHKGRLLEVADRFVVGMNTYRAQGGGGYACVRAKDIIHRSSVSLNHLLVNYLENCGTVSPRPEPVWSFQAIRGATALFQSSPDAIKHLSDTCTPNVAPHGAGQNGFSTFRIAFDNIQTLAPAVLHHVDYAPI